jgi:hypothetical protein
MAREGGRPEGLNLRPRGLVARPLWGPVFWGILTFPWIPIPYAIS